MNIFLLLCPIAYIILNLYVNRKINRANYLKEERRRLHKRFIWVLPFLGPLMIRGFWKKKKDTGLEITTIEDRKTEAGGFHESGIGMVPLH